MNNAFEKEVLVSAGFASAGYKGAPDLQDEVRVGRHDLIITVDFDFDDMMAVARCEEWDFEVIGRFDNASELLVWVDEQVSAVETLIDAD